MRLFHARLDKAVVQVLRHNGIVDKNMNVVMIDIGIVEEHMKVLIRRKS